MKLHVEVKIAIQDLTGQFVVLEVFAWRLLIVYIPPMLSNAFLNIESIKDLNFKLGIQALNAQRGLQTFYENINHFEKTSTVEY